MRKRRRRKEEKREGGIGFTHTPMMSSKGTARNETHRLAHIHAAYIADVTRISKTE